jgi:hypothetical protein
MIAPAMAGNAYFDLGALRPHLSAALEEARLCSNDPVCAEHNPSAQHDPMHLQGAACHGCLLIAETSCEQRNDWLDRALVVPTDQAAAARGRYAAYPARGRRRRD